MSQTPTADPLDYICRCCCGEVPKPPAGTVPGRIHRPRDPDEPELEPPSWLDLRVKDLAKLRGVSRQRASQILAKERARWAEFYKTAADSEGGTCD